MASVTYSATQADGIASDFSNAGVPRIEVLSNKYSTNTGTAECAGIGTAGPAFSVAADLQIDCDIYCALGAGFAESVVISLRDSTNYSGYGFQTTNQSIASSWCLLRYPAGGGGATKVTTVTRTNGAAEHLTFTRANSTGVMNLYSNGTLVTTYTDATYVAGQLFIIALLDSGAPGSATTLDNIVISDVITGPPSSGMAAASGIGASTATAVRLGSARPIAATTGIGASTAVALRLGLARPIAAASGIGGSTTTAVRLGGGKALAAVSGIGGSTAVATTLLSAGMNGTAAGLSTAGATGLVKAVALAGTADGASTFSADEGLTLGTAGGIAAYVYTPNPSPFSVLTGDLCVVADIAPTAWSGTIMQIASRWGTAYRRSWQWSLAATGQMFVSTSADGVAQASSTSTSSTNLAAQAAGTRLMVAFAIDVDNGASGSSTRFWWSNNGGSSWTQLGTTRTTAGATSLYSPPTGLGDIAIGGIANTVAGPFTGDIFSVSIRNGTGAVGTVGGTEVARFEGNGLWTGHYTDAYSVDWASLRDLLVATSALTGAGLSSTTAALTTNRPLAGSADGVSTAGATLSSGNSIAFTASQPDGPAIDFASAGAAHVVEVLNRQYSSNGYTSATTDYGLGTAVIPFDISGDLQVDLDLTAPLVTGSGGVNLFFVNSSDSSGYGIFAGNSWHIQRYNVGGSHTNLTNDARSVRAEHLTFTRRASDGQMNAYANGTLVSFIADLGSIVTGQTMALYLVDTDYATLGEATADNIVVSNIITGPPPAGAVSAESLGTSSTAAALSVGKGIAGTSTATSTAAAVGLSLTKQLQATSTGAAGTTGLLGILKGLQGASAGTATSTSDLQVAAPGSPFAGASAGLSAATGTLVQARPLAGTATGTAATTAGLSRAVPMTATVVGLSTAAASALVTGSGFSGNTAGTGAAGAVSLAALVALSGAAAGAGSGSAGLRSALALSALATAAGLSATTGAISVAVFAAVQVWYGGTWQTMTIRVWNGTDWSATAQVWNGTEWQVLA